MRLFNGRTLFYGRNNLMKGRVIRHNGLINALACVGLEPTRDPNDANLFHVRAADVEGQWSKNPDGAVFVAITRENDQVKGHGTVKAFLEELTKKPRRNPRKTMN
jgi:hypothetical protein